MATNNNGIIYYKLDSYAHGYPGDITKNCGLRGEEIDGNFNFLRGNDIASISFDDNGIHLTKLNGERLTAKPSGTPEYGFQYDSNSGTLVIDTPNGETIKLDGFKVTTNVYHDFTLTGNGSAGRPLAVSNNSKTGRYRPAIKLIDTINTNETLPTENLTKHDRYVTKEKISRFGRLYSLADIYGNEEKEGISDRLKNIGCGWHIPSKAEWDTILDAIDCALPKGQKHSDNYHSNVEVGEFAGAALKASHETKFGTDGYWKPTTDGKVYAEDKYGFTIYPVGYCGNRGTYYEDSFGETAAFWTCSEEDEVNDMYVKIFNYDSEKVGQNTWSENYHLSLRLVKTITDDNFNDAEEIDGRTYNCVQIPNTNLLWTKENVSFSEYGIVPKEWEQYEDDAYEIRYFVNDWNGNNWNKNEIKEGEGIVLLEGDNGDMHEWILVKGELIDSAALLKEEFTKKLDEIEGKFDALEEADKVLGESIDKLGTTLAEVSTKLDNEIKEREDVDTQLQDKITTLREDIDAEINRAQEAETQLTNELNAEIDNRVNADKNLQKQIDENKVIPADEDNSVVIIAGSTDENNVTTPTTIKVNLDSTCEHLKLGENGIYFDGYFGTF